MAAELLTSNEKIILLIIREYLDQNRIFRLKDIVPFITERVAKSPNPLNDYEVQKILWSLIRKKIVSHFLWLKTLQQLKNKPTVKNSKRCYKPRET